MKPLKVLDNVERAKLLATLFPDQIKDFLTHLELQAHELITQEDQARESWVEAFVISFNDWLLIAQHLHNEISFKRKEITRQPKVFAELLFYRGYSLYSVHHLNTYAAKESCPEPFRLAIKLLFTDWK